MKNTLSNKMKYGYKEKLGIEKLVYSITGPKTEESFITLTVKSDNF